MEIYGTILQYKRFAVHDGDGIRTTLFLKGCPLRCAWCHNPEGIDGKPELAYLTHKCINCGECMVCEYGAHSFADGKHEFDRQKCVACGKCAGLCLGGALTLYGTRVTANQAADELLNDYAFFRESGGGVTLSGGEPLLQPKFTAEVFRLVKERSTKMVETASAIGGISTVGAVSTALDTCGYANRESLDMVLPYTDKVLYDIKAADSKVHEKYTGRPNEMILSNLRYINSRFIAIEIRIPLIPGVNDGDADAISKLLAPLESVTAVRILPYHKYAATKYASLGKTYFNILNPPTHDTLERFASTLDRYGLRIIRSW